MRNDDLQARIRPVPFSSKSAHFTGKGFSRARGPVPQGGPDAIAPLRANGGPSRAFLPGSSISGNTSGDPSMFEVMSREDLILGELPVGGGFRLRISARRRGSTDLVQLALVDAGGNLGRLLFFPAGHVPKIITILEGVKRIAGDEPDQHFRKHHKGGCDHEKWK